MRYKIVIEKGESSCGALIARFAGCFVVGECIWGFKVQA